MTDEKNEPIIGANVVVKGSTTGTITDMDGNFTLEVPDQATLLVSYIGAILLKKWRLKIKTIFLS